MQQQLRYLIEALDPRTYLIVDKSGTEECFLLLVSPVEAPHVNVQIDIVEVIKDNDRGSLGYVEATRETLSFKMFVNHWDQVVAIVSQILADLNRGVDASNPVELAHRYGATLLGELVQWPPHNLIDLH